jgi:hypothetical protein
VLGLEYRKRISPFHQYGRALLLGQRLVGVRAPSQAGRLEMEIKRGGWQARFVPQNRTHRPIVIAAGNPPPAFVRLTRGGSPTGIQRSKAMSRSKLRTCWSGPTRRRRAGAVGPGGHDQGGVEHPPTETYRATEVISHVFPSISGISSGIRQR